MSKDFETRKNNYRNELSAYLCEKKLTIAEYASYLGEECITPILYPEEEHALELAKRAFEIFKAVFDALEHSRFDIDNNLAYAYNMAIIEGIHNKESYKSLEDFLLMIMADPHLNGRFCLEMLQLAENKDTNLEFFGVIIKESMICGGGVDNLQRIINKNHHIVEARATRTLASINFARVKQLKAFLNLTGMERFVVKNGEIYDYIIEEQLNIPFGLRKPEEV